MVKMHARILARGALEGLYVSTSDGDLNEMHTSALDAGEYFGVPEVARSAGDSSVMASFRAAYG